MTDKELLPLLGVGSNTLRLWSMEFAAFLSPSAQAQVSEKGTPLQRRYADHDVLVFGKTKEFRVVLPDPKPPPGNSAIVSANSHHVDNAEHLALLRRNNELQEQIVALLSAKKEEEPPPPEVHPDSVVALYRRFVRWIKT